MRANLASLVLALACFNAAFAQDSRHCDSILAHGVSDYFLDTGATASAANVRNEVNRAMSDLRRDQLSGGAAVSYGLFGGEVQVSSDQLKAINESFSSSSASANEQSDRFTKIRQVMNSEAVAAWQACVSREPQTNLRVNTDFPDDPSAPVNFIVRYVPPPGVNPTIEVSVGVTPAADAFRCRWFVPNRGFVDAGPADKLKVRNGNELSLTCTRKLAAAPFAHMSRMVYATPARIDIQTTNGAISRPFAAVPAVSARKQEPREPPIGSIVAWAGTVDRIPSGWRVCDGASLKISEWPELYSAIGKSWGGNDTHFNVPDLRGRFLRGVDMGVGRDPDKASRGPNAPGGASGDSVGSIEGDAFREHSHGVNDPGHTHSVGRGFLGDCNGGYGAMRSGGGAMSCDFLDLNRPHMSTQGSNVSVRSAGGSETRPQNANVYWIVRVRER
ncbi:tail fiber protein [Corallococcus sp. CA053C]|uniref:tail fiber protein n=1 Tax=Corallococcus sp. CA053C TaxID=2316732 RepID=UPI000EA29247|nr:tail fiber protein [Corallococcus sp. CA053C]RKH11191.1 tail fiber protein [Corallococcus sp. CA053C]